VVLGSLILRRRGLYFSLITLAFTQLFYEIAFQWDRVTGGENGLQGMTRPGLESDLAFHLFCSAVVIVAIYLVWRVVHSPFGRVLQAIRENEQRARCLGYNTHRYKLVAFVLSAMFMGLAGSLLTFLIQGVYADVMNWQNAGDTVLMTVLGGMHHFLGPLWGAFTFILLRDQLSSITEHWWLVFGAVLIGFILLSPEGLSGIFARLRRGPRWNLTRTILPPRPHTMHATENGRAVKDDQPVLSVRALSKQFGSLVVADGINLELRQGEIYSLIGPNGAGKTTFFNMVTGLVPCDGGQILFKNREIGPLPPNQRVDAGLGRSFQILSIFKNLTVFENVRVAVQARSNHRFAFWRNAYSYQDVNERTWSILDSMGLSEHADQTAVDLPHGEQRLLEIAITIGTEPEVLLLDEPLAGLSHEDRERISALIQGLAGCHSILLIEHDIDRVLAISNRITILHQGRVIAQGVPQEVMNQPEVVTAYLGRKPAAVAVAETPVRKARSLTAAPLLKLNSVVSGYEGSSVLRDVDLEVGEGEVVALLGRNGVGKTTTLRTIIGALKPMAGTIEFNGQQIGGRPAYRINRQGISIVPEGRRIFPNLTVLNNLQLAQRAGGCSVEEAFELFPGLRKLQTSKGENLSGGELQMLAIARALMAPTKLMLLDEPLEGLAPTIVNEVVRAIGLLRGRTSILIVEQNDLVLQMADRAYVMVSGQIAYAGDAEALRQDEALQLRLLGV
jgi:ABC-type branched-subunit amino acid transport system ATPase component